MHRCIEASKHRSLAVKRNCSYLPRQVLISTFDVFSISRSQPKTGAVNLTPPR